jgi:hyperosmotically inducible protein
VQRINPLLMTAFALGCSVMLAQEPDNSKMNKQATTTADQAKNNKSDVKLMKQIRKAIVKDKSLSTYAHNTKIVASNGKVTVSGPVKSEDEKKVVIQKATEIAGADNVTDQLTVDSDKH